MFLLCSILGGVSLSVGLILYALRHSVDLYYTPTQLLALSSYSIPAKQEIRLGGIVVAGSIHRYPATLKINFTITDGDHKIKIFYAGMLPNLFREGQGIIAQGQFNPMGIFVADTILAKHDATYRPPGSQSP